MNTITGADWARVLPAVRKRRREAAARVAAVRVLMVPAPGPEFIRLRESFVAAVHQDAAASNAQKKSA